MKFYISTTGIKRLTISNSNSNSTAALKSSPLSSTASLRRISTRSIFPLLLTLSILLPFFFLRFAFLLLESAAACSSSLDCSGWTLFPANHHASSRLSEELSRAIVDSKDSGTVGVEDGVASFNQLVKDMISKRQDMRAFALKTKAMLHTMEQKVKSARNRESVYWYLASHGVPKGLHCLSLKLAEEYAVNAKARARLPQPEYVSRLTDPLFRHVVLLTDNVLAASVVVSSAIRNSVEPHKLVFHIVTDKKTYTPMHAWFATNSVDDSVVVEIKGLHHFEWSEDVNSRVKDMLEIHRLIWKRYYDDFKGANFDFDGEDKRKLDVLSPSSLSLLNHLRIYVPELFPDLNKIVFPKGAALKNENPLSLALTISVRLFTADGHSRRRSFYRRPFNRKTERKKNPSLSRWLFDRRRRQRLSCCVCEVIFLRLPNINLPLSAERKSLQQWTGWKFHGMNYI